MEGAVGIHWEKEMKWGVKKVLPPTKVAPGCKVKPFWGARREEALLVFGVIWFDLYVRPFGLTWWGSPPEGVLECRGRASWLFCQWLNAEAVSRQRGEQHLPLTEARQGSSHLSVAAPISIYLKYWSEQGGSFCSDRILSMDTCENRKKGRKKGFDSYTEQQHKCNTFAFVPILMETKNGSKNEKRCPLFLLSVVGNN